MTEEKAKATGLTWADFELYLMEYIYEEPMPASLLQQLKDFEKAHPEYAEICSALRATKNLTDNIPEIEVSERLDQKVLQLAKQTSKRATFLAVLEPVGWIAAAALLLSCGYLFGLMSSSSSHHQLSTQQLTNRRAQRRPPARALMAADVAMVFEKIHGLSNSTAAKPSLVNDQTSWRSLCKIQAFLPQTERCLELYEQSGDRDHLKVAQVLIERCLTLVRKGGFDGVLSVNSEYKSRLKKLQRKLSAISAKTHPPTNKVK